MQKKLESIQIVRGIAVIAVVFFHCQQFSVDLAQALSLRAPILWVYSKQEAIGSFGVDIFFVISGFVMSYITYKNHNKNYFWTFIKKRFIRVAPLYWLFTLIMILLLITFPNNYYSKVDLKSIVYSFLFIPFIPTNFQSSPILPVGWTLNYEIFFYIIVAFGLFLKRRLFIISCGLSFIILISVPLLMRPTSTALIFLTNYFIIEFYIGFIICDFFMKYKLNKNVVTILSIFTFILVILVCKNTSTSNIKFVYCVMSALLVICFSFYEKLHDIHNLNALKFIGDCSYSIYLSHYILIPILGSAIKNINISQYISIDMFLLYTWTVTIAAGCFIYLYVENPIIGYIKAITLKK